MLLVHLGAAASDMACAGVVKVGEGVSKISFCFLGFLGVDKVSLYRESGWRNLTKSA